MSVIIADTGPLVAYLDRSDLDHEWGKETFMQITRPLLTCEAVIAEALFLLRRGGIHPDGLRAFRPDLSSRDRLPRIRGRAFPKTSKPPLHWSSRTNWISHP